MRFTVLAWQMLRLNWANNAWIFALVALPVMVLLLEASAPSDETLFFARVTSELMAIAGP